MATVARGAFVAITAWTAWALLAPAGLAQPIRAPGGGTLTHAAIDGAMNTILRKYAVAGLGLALIQNGQIVYLHAYGLRGVTGGGALTPDTPVRAASLTKATFATMVMQLVDAGTIDLDRSIAAYLPKALPAYPDYADLADDARWRRLTFRILLAHTTGFANYRGFEDDGRLRFHWDPGTRYGYSGEGFNLAQFVLEQGLRLDAAREMQARIFDRFGMTRTFMTGAVDPGFDTNGALVAEGPPPGLHVASSMRTTLRDWGHFLAGVVRGDGLSAKAKAEMIRLQIPIESRVQVPTLRAETTRDWRPIKLGYGIGWGVFDTPYGHAFFKEGHDDGVENYALCIQPRQTCVLLLSNDNRAAHAFKPILDALWGEVGVPWRWEGYTP